MKSLILFLAATVVFFSCNKKEENTKAADSFEYIVNGVSDVSIPATGSAVIGLSAEYKSGTQEAITFSLSKLPAGIKDSFSSISGTPTFGSFLVLTSDKATTGTSKITLTARTASGKSKEYNFNLTVIPPEDCRTKLAGTYTYNTTCNPGFTHDLDISLDPSNADRILIKDFPAGDVYATVNCQTKTFIIPKQTAGRTSYETQGSGNFTDGNISITYTHVPGPGTTCNLSGTK